MKSGNRYRSGETEKELQISTMLIEEEDLRIGICAVIYDPALTGKIGQKLIQV